MRRKVDLNCSLEELEKWLAQELDSWLRQRLETGGLSVRSAEALIKARERCAGKLERQSEPGTVAVVRRFLEEQRSASYEHALRNLTYHLGSLVERCGASTGSLMIVRRNGGKETLGELIPHNVPADWKLQSYPLNPPDERAGITVQAVVTKRGQIENDVRLGPLKHLYKEANRSTRAEIALPIFGNRSWQGENTYPIGVLNIESEEINAFVGCQLGELQAATWALAPDLLIIRHIEDSETSGGWHHEIHTWNPTEFLQDLCDEIARAHSVDYAEQRLVLTVWEADWRKAYLYARSVVRFNYEYLSDKILPLLYEEGAALDEVGRNTQPCKRRRPKVPARSWMHGEESFTGMMASTKRGFVQGERISACGNYHNRIKAERMGIEYIVSTAIYELASRGKRRSFSSGVLNFYFFRRYLSLNGGPTIALPESDVAWLADVIGELKSSHAEVRPGLAASVLRARLFEKGVRLLDIPLLLRRLVQEIFAAAGCSVLVCQAPPEGSQRSVELSGAACVLTTSGLVNENGEPAQDGETNKYLGKCDDIEDGWRVVRGITALLAATGAAIVRKADVQDQWEIGCWKPWSSKASAWLPNNRGLFSRSTLVMPSFRVHESTTPTNSDHRRLLAVSIPLPAPGHVGIIRVVREAHAPPFAADDEGVLCRLADAFAPYFMLSERDAGKLLETSSPSEMLGSPYPNGENSAFPSTRGPDGGELPWNARYVDSLMQYLLDKLKRDCRGACACPPSFDSVMLKARALDTGGQEVLRVYKGFSKFAAHVLTELKIEEQKTRELDRRNSAEWHALEGKKAILILWKEGEESVKLDNQKLFTPYRTLLGRNRFAILVPAYVGHSPWIRESSNGVGNVGDLLIQIEGHFEDASWNPSDMGVLLLSALRPVCECCRALGCLSRDNSAFPIQTVRGDWNCADDIVKVFHQALRDHVCLPNCWVAKSAEELEEKGLNSVRTLFKKVVPWYGCLPVLESTWISYSPLDILESDLVRAVVESWRDLVLKRDFSDKLIPSVEAIRSSGAWKSGGNFSEISLDQLCK